MTYAELRARHLSEARAAMPAHLERLAWSRDRIEAEQERGLRAMLAHARAHSPWHRARLDGFDLERASLADLPTMSKSDVMQHWDEIVTVQELRLADAEAFYRGLEQPAYFRDRYQVFASGGSSGRRGCYVWDWDFFTTTANSAFRHIVRDEGASRASGRRAVLTAGKPSHASTPLFSYNPDPDEHVGVVSVMQPLPAMIAQLERLEPTMLIGYSSVIHRLAEEALAGRLRIRPKRVSTNSEPLLPEMRRDITDAWACIVNNTWGSTEAGMHAIQSDASPGLLLNEDLIILERVDAENRLVDDNAPCARILVTNLFNRTFPFLRYEMDDVVTFLPGKSPCGSAYRMIGDIEGRQDDEFHYAGGTIIHPIVFREPLGEDGRIEEYQVRQTERGADVLVVGRELDASALEARIEASLRSHGLPDPSVRVSVVDSISRHGETGKLKRFVRREPSVRR